MEYPSNRGDHRALRGRTVEWSGVQDSGGRTVERPLCNKNGKHNEEAKKTSNKFEEDFQQTPHQHDGPDRSRKENTDKNAD